jgi:hypothetical protein
MITIHEKPYETVAERVRKFRSACPAQSGWGVVTEILEITEKIVRMQAKIISPANLVVATGHAQEVWSSSYINKTSALENCETSAIGRALMSAGFGGGEFASAEEVMNAIQAQGEIEEAVKKAESKPAKPASKPEQEVGFIGVDEFITKIQECNNVVHLKNLWEKYKHSINMMSEAQKKRVMAAKDKRKDEIKQKIPDETIIEEVENENV